MRLECVRVLRCGNRNVEWRDSIRLSNDFTFHVLRNLHIYILRCGKRAGIMSGKRWLTWITTKNRREILLFVGGGLVVIGGAGWAAFQYFDKPSVKMEVTYRLCVGFEPKYWPPGSILVKGYAPMARPDGSTYSVVAEWVKRECANYSRKDTVVRSGPASECGCAIVEVKCSSE